jgi:hypothetical protein
VDFDIDIGGYEKIVSDYTYNEWIELLESYDLPTDFLMTAVKPERVLVLDYYGDAVGTFGASIEIYEYATVEDAELEFAKQKPDSQSDYGKKMFNRYETEEIMLCKNKFLIFAYSVPIYGNADHDLGASMLNNLMDDFIENFIDVLTIWREDGEESPPPPVSFNGEVIWGIKPSDIMSWEQGESSQYSSSDTITRECEIVKISDDNLSVLVREHYDSFCAYSQPGWAGKLARDDYKGIVYDTEFDTPHYDYYWVTADEDGIELKDDYCKRVLIYPLYKGEESLKDMIESEISYLPETSVTESADSITGHGITSSGMGFTPLETQWLDITVHKGTGIVTHADWYYQNREYDIQASSEATLKDANFVLQSRQAYLPQEDAEPEPIETVEPTEPIEPSPTESQPTESEPTELNQSLSIITSEVAIAATIAIACVITVVVFLAQRRR